MPCFPGKQEVDNRVTQTDSWIVRHETRTLSSLALPFCTDLPFKVYSLGKDKGRLAFARK